jgi:hypothetical protein
MSHDTRSRAQVLSGQLNECPHAFEPGGFPGFGYLFDGENPGNRARSQLGADPARAHELLLALSQALPPGRGYWETPLQPGLDPDDNPRIPSGYTYLLQLVAHDAVQTSVPFWAAAAHGLASRNLRSSPLVLDTLYGGGPSASPVAYKVAGYSAADRTTLRVGRYQSANTGQAATDAQCPFRDLARINAYTEPGNLLPANFDYAYVTCTADARNDDNLVLAQLTALFANVHGAIAQRVRATRPEAIFGYAQVAVQRIYHAVVAHDLLPKLLHPRMDETLESLRDPGASDRRWLWQSNRMPLEFTHGAFRVGHAMVRHTYRVNDTLAGTLGLPDVVDGGPRWGETRLPLRESWLVRWSRFFQMPHAGIPNLSRRISPTQSAIDAADLFKATDPGQPDGLAMRDMLSGALARTWHVDALLARILAENSNPIPSDWLLRDENRRRDEIGGWLSRWCSGLTATQIDMLSRDPPLPFFVLLESALDPAIAGRHLGPLGSTIIGEVIGRTIAQERRGMEAVQCAAERAFPSDFWDEMTGITSMRQLIEFAARHCEFEAASAPFI